MVLFKSFLSDWCVNTVMLSNFKTKMHILPVVMDMANKHFLTILLECKQISEIRRSLITLIIMRKLNILYILLLELYNRLRLIINYIIYIDVIIFQTLITLKIFLLFLFFCSLSESVNIKLPKKSKFLCIITYFRRYAWLIVLEPFNLLYIIQAHLSTF